MISRNSVRNACLLTPLVAVLLAVPAIGAEHFVTANPDNTFSPAVLDIQVGDTVTWSNGGGLHNVAAPGLFRCANGCDGDGMGGNGDPAVNPWSFSLTFNDPGAIDYVCEVHEDLGMVGTVNVLGDGPALTISGTCPGTIDVAVTGGTPGGSIALVRSNSLGNTTVPGGGCAGTQLDLDGAALLSILPLDGNGEFTTTRNVAGALCGAFLQALDLDTCQTTNTAQLP